MSVLPWSLETAAVIIPDPPPIQPLLKPLLSDPEPAWLWVLRAKPSGLWSLHFDGAVEPVNPGGWMSWAWQLSDGQQSFSGGDVRPPRKDNTNNVAEYFGCGSGLKFLAALRRIGYPCRQLSIFGDSRLVVEQLSNRWKCYKPFLRRCRDRCWTHLQGLSWTANWVPRERNDYCDGLTKSLLAAQGVEAVDRREWNKPSRSNGCIKPKRY